MSGMTGEQCEWLALRIIRQQLTTKEPLPVVVDPECPPGNAYFMPGQISMSPDIAAALVSWAECQGADETMRPGAQRPDEDVLK